MNKKIKLVSQQTISLVRLDRPKLLAKAKVNFHSSTGEGLHILLENFGISNISFTVPVWK
jgi:hypothetical protein